MKTLVNRNFSTVLLLINFIFLFIFSQNIRAEQVITIAQGATIQSLDAHRSNAKPDMSITTAINETLAINDFEKMDIVPRLATSWRMVDTRTWEFKLRKNVRFTNGEPFDGNCVKFSLERIKDPQTRSIYTGYMKPLQEVKVIDSYTVHIIGDPPAATTPLRVTELPIVPPNYIREKGAVEFGKKPVGTGPFMIANWVKDEYVELIANRNYWGGKPELDRAIFKSIPENLTRIAALQTGEADLITNVLMEEIPSIQKRKDLKIIVSPSLRVFFVQFNLIPDTPLRDKRVRLAMNYAVDVDSIIKNVLQGYGTKLDGQILSKEYWGYNPKIKAFPHDPEKARKLMKESGHEDYEFTLAVPSGRYLRDKEVGMALAGQLNAAGIKTKVQIMEWGAFLDKLQARKHENMGLWGAATPPTAEIILGTTFRTGVSTACYVNPEYDKLYDEATMVPDKDERLKAFHNLIEYLYNNPPLLYLYQSISIYGTNNRVSAWKPRPDELIDLLFIHVK